jgi:DHA2 family lincomycin resistance protein-like MFS transporter
MALLIVGSVVAALAPSFVVLLIGRGIQGLGVGLLIPFGMNITLEYRHPPRNQCGYRRGYRCHLQGISRPPPAQNPSCKGWT